MRARLRARQFALHTFAHTRACVCVMFWDALGPSMDTLTVCFKPACGALCILHESTVLYVSNPFVCPNAQRKHKHSADLLFVERCLRVRTSLLPESGVRTRATDSAGSRARTHAHKIRLRNRNFEHRTLEKSDFALCPFLFFVIFFSSFCRINQKWADICLNKSIFVVCFSLAGTKILSPLIQTNRFPGLN